MNSLILTEKEIFVLEKVKSWCALRERCIKEVKDNIYKYGVSDKISQHFINYLIKENYINELRFANQFVSGKFNINKWGKIKIEYELKKRNIKEEIIKQAISIIDENSYSLTVSKLIKLKLKESKMSADQDLIVIRNLMSKGFEYNVIIEALKTLKQNKK